MKTFEEYAEMAKALPKNSATPIYQDLEGRQYSGETFHAIEGDKMPDAVALFKAVRSGCNGRAVYKNGFLYLTRSKVGEDGRTLPRGVYNEELYFHRKWARMDTPVLGASFRVVGLKRASTHLPAAVLVAGVEFLI